MNNEELDSQLSAMFDGELSSAECELLARRLSRDEALKARWGRYAVISAAIRAEHGVRLDANVARRVRAAIAKEPALAVDPVPVRGNSGSSAQWLRPAVGFAVAASVAVAAVLWLREQPAAVSDSTLVAQQEIAQESRIGTVGSEAIQAQPVDEQVDTYVVPQPSEIRSIVPVADLANYVVAHSEFSTPLSRRNLLSAFVASESGTAGAGDESEEAFEEPVDDEGVQ